MAALSGPAGAGSQRRTCRGLSVAGWTKTSALPPSAPRADPGRHRGGKLAAELSAGRPVPWPSLFCALARAARIVPELPEVETVRRGPQPHLEAASGCPRWCSAVPTLRFLLPERFVAARLDRVQGVPARRRRRNISRAELDTGETLAVHLGMTGRVPDSRGREYSAASTIRSRARTSTPTSARDRSRRPGALQRHPRRFGYMDLILTEGLAGHARLKGLGPEPLEDAFDAKAPARRSPARADMVQKRPCSTGRLARAGLGNIDLSREALHRAKLASTPRGGLKPAEVPPAGQGDQGYACRRHRRGGSTLNDYRQADGSLGYFQHAFRVYDREGEPRPAEPGSEPSACVRARWRLRLDLHRGALPEVKPSSLDQGALSLAPAVRLRRITGATDPPMWVIERKARGVVDWLGSVHLLSAEAVWRTKRLDDELARADQIWPRDPHSALLPAAVASATAAVDGNTARRPDPALAVVGGRPCSA